MSEEQTVTYELDGEIALVGLNRPDKRNCFNPTVMKQLRAAVFSFLRSPEGSGWAGLTVAEASPIRPVGRKPTPSRHRRAMQHSYDALDRPSHATQNFAQQPGIKYVRNARQKWSASSRTQLVGMYVAELARAAPA